MKKQQLFILAGIIVILIGVVVLMWGKKMTQELPQHQNQIQEDVVKTPHVGNLDTSDWKTYRNEEYGFEVKMPKNWEVDIQSHAGEILPIREAITKNKILENKEYSIQFSFGPRESKAGGYVAGIHIESRMRGSIDDIIKKDFSWENQEKVFIQEQPVELLCWKSGCRQGETGIDKRFLFEKDGLVWQIFGSVSSEKGSEEKVREIEDFFSSFQFLD